MPSKFESLKFYCNVFMENGLHLFHTQLHWIANYKVMLGAHQNFAKQFPVYDCYFSVQAT